MTLSKTVRRFVAGIVAVVVLLCQTTSLAQAYARSVVHHAGSVVQPAPMMAHAPCQDAGANDMRGPARDAHPARCLSQAASSSPALPDIPLLAGLQALVVRVAASDIDGAALAISTPPPLRGKPPPLTILHCCLRN